MSPVKCTMCGSMTTPCDCLPWSPIGVPFRNPVICKHGQAKENCEDCKQIADLEGKNAELLKFSKIKPPGDEQLVALQSERIEELKSVIQSALDWLRSEEGPRTPTTNIIVERLEKAMHKENLP